ncbi:MAG: NERD domain-containing protein [Chloroflexi bacterium]|nr:NERD domain-containing protein [Chloroflexota bacterium]
MRVLKQSSYAYLQEQYTRNKKWGIWCLVAGIAALLGMWNYLSILAIILGAWLLRRSWRYWRTALNYRAGILGEQAVADALRELDDSYCLIEDVMAGSTGGNIDHVLLSSKSIFVIETKNYSGHIRCYGDRWFKKGRRGTYEIRSVSQQVRKNADYITDLIRRRVNMYLPVKPICVFTNPWVELKLHNPPVTVLQLAELPRFITQSPRVASISDWQIQKISRCILGEQGDKL